MPRAEKDYEALADFAERDLDSIDATEFTPVASQIIRLREAVAAKKEALAAADTEITAAVEAMRLGGFSWERIALVLGVTRQAAHAQYAEKIHQ